MPKNEDTLAQLKYEQELKRLLSKEKGKEKPGDANIGKRNPTDGTYETRRANGSIERGIRTSNGGTTTDQIVRGIQGDGVWGLDWRNVAQRPTVNLEPTKYHFVAICAVYNDGFSEIKKWVIAGGAKVKQIPQAVVTEFEINFFSNMFIENLGDGFLVTFNKFNSYESSKTLLMKNKGSNLRTEITSADYPLANEPRTYRYHKYGYATITVNCMPISGFNISSIGINYFPAPIKESILNTSLSKITTKPIGYDFNPLGYFNSSEVPVLSTKLQNQWNAIDFGYVNPFAENEVTFYNLLARNKDASKAIYSETYQQGEYRYISNIGGQWIYKVNSLYNKFYLASKNGNITEINSDPGFRSAIRNELPEAIEVGTMLTLETSLAQRGDNLSSYIFDSTDYAKNTNNDNDLTSLLFLNRSRIQSALAAGRTAFVAWYKNGKFTRVKGNIISWTEYDLNPGSSEANKTFCVNTITLQVTKVEKPFIDIPYAERAARWGNSVGKAELYTSNGSICELSYTLSASTAPSSGGMGYIELELVKYSTFIDNRIFLAPPIITSTSMKKYAADEYILMPKDGKINVVRKGTVEGRLNIPKNSRIINISYHP